MSSDNQVVDTIEVPSIFEGLPFEEDIEEAVAKFVEVLGPQGRYVESGINTLYSMRIYSPKYGFLWYGDMKISDLGKIKKLSADLDIPVVVVSEHNASEYYTFKRYDSIDDFFANNLTAMVGAEAIFKSGEIVKLRYSESDIG